MSQLDDLRSAGFSDDEANTYVASKRQSLLAGGFSDQEADAYLGTAKPQPDMQAAHRALADSVLNQFAQHMGGEWQTAKDIATGYGPAEAITNAFTGMIRGFASLTGNVVGLGQKYVAHSANTLVDEGVDPKAMGEKFASFFADKPETEAGKRLSEQFTQPLRKLQDLAEWGGHKATDAATNAGASDNVAAAIGALIDSSVQVLPQVLLGELGRRAAGQPVTSEDMANTAKAVAGPGADPAAVEAAETSLRAVYSKTGIGPYTILEAADRDPRIAAELVDPGVEIPQAFREFQSDPVADWEGEGGRVAEEPPEDAARWRTYDADGDLVASFDTQAEAEAARAATSGDEGRVVEPEKAISVERALQLNSGADPTQIIAALRGAAVDVTNGVVSSKVGQEAVAALMPMSTGSQIAQAAAQRFANAMRVARFQWQRIGDFLERGFSPEERRAMWEAADEENVLRQQGLPTEGRGLERLTPGQRNIMTELHELANSLWERAKGAGMVTGEGLPFWTPRMAVMIGEDGEYARPRSKGGGATATGVGSNVTTTAQSLRQRKHLLAEDTESGMRSTLGDEAHLVRDILTMPLAMSRLGRAIAGRELVNQLREMGTVSGEKILSEGLEPGFVTIDHPAFTSYRPEFVTDAEGKTVPRVDESGDIVMQRVPLQVSPEWAGPLRSVMSVRDGAIYSAYMLMKSKAMAAIMISPATHNMVIWGRALAYNPAAMMTLRSYFTGHALLKNAELVNQAITDGQVPMGANKSSMMDITDVARGLGKSGGWGDTNESWVSLSARAVGNLFADGLGDNAKARLDAFGDFWHHTLLWKQVGALQMYIYNDYRNYMLTNGHPPEVAGPIAAHLSNRYAGAVASENSSELLRKALNVMLFSRSFNVGNIGAVHDTAFGLPSGLRSKMFVEAGDAPATAGIDQAKAKARMGLVADLGMSMLFTAATSAAVAVLLQNQTAQDVADGYLRRFHEALQNAQEHPLTPDSYNPYRLLPSADNEAGKQDRIDLGAQAGGRHEYLRLPTGKVVEDTVGWLMHAPDTFVKKMAPIPKAVWQAITNDKGFGVPVEDPEGGTLKHITQGLEHVMEAQVPIEELKTLHDVAEGVGTPLDKQKLAGFATGFSTSQGNPHGPEVGAYYAQQDRVKADKAYAMEAVKDDLKHGRDAQAYDRLKAAGLTPRDIIYTINNIKNPRQGMSRNQARTFKQEATPEDAIAMEHANRQAE